MVPRCPGMMPGRDMKRPAKRLMKESRNDPTEDRAAWYYKPCGTRSGHGSLDRGPSQHEMPTRKRVRNKTPSSTRREGSAREKVEIREGENEEKGVSPEGVASKPRPRTLENQGQEGLNRLRNVRFPPAPLKGLVAPKEFKGVISESFRRILSKVSGNHSNKAM